MNAREYRKIRQHLKAGRLCPCGARAVDYTDGTWTCAMCIEKDRAIYASERIRGTCGFAGALDFYRLAI